MPEGHTVHRLALAFGELFRGQALEVWSPQGRFADGAALLDGMTLVGADAVGKQMVLDFAAGPAEQASRYLRVHLGLYGSWRFAGDTSFTAPHSIGAPRRRVGETEASTDVDDPDGAIDDRPWLTEPRGQIRVRMIGEHGMGDLSGPTACEVITADEVDALVARLGPDPIRRDADPDRFLDRLGCSRTPVGIQLMDQSVVAGVGNIYRAEVLFRAGVDPYRPGKDVPREVAREMWDDLVVLMRDGVKAGRIVTTRPGDRGTAKAQRAGSKTVARYESFYVYKREGEPCRVCGTPVSIAAMQARKLYWCSSCQV